MPAKNKPAAQAKEPKVPEQAEVKMVVPISRGALQVLLQLIDAAQILGKDMEPVMQAKMELIRVAGLRDGR